MEMAVTGGMCMKQKGSGPASVPRLFGLMAVMVAVLTVFLGFDSLSGWCVFSLPR